MFAASAKSVPGILLELLAETCVFQLVFFDSETSNLGIQRLRRNSKSLRGLVLAGHSSSRGFQSRFNNLLFAFRELFFHRCQRSSTGTNRCRRLQYFSL